MLGFVTRLARFMALLGGVVLTALIVLTCVSVLGRGLNTLGHSDFLSAAAPSFGKALIAAGVGPVDGDFEIVEAGIALAIFAFLPICQLKSAHASVDVFTDLLPGRVNGWLIAFWEIVLTLVILLIAWRLFEGFLSKYGNGETTLLLQFPIWWAYGASVVAALAASITALWCAFGRVAALITGDRYLPPPGEADH